MKTHWKKLYNPNYMGSYSFNEGEVKELKIKAIKKEPVTGQNGKKEEVTVIHWEGKEKPLICNKTNAKAIATLTGSDYIEDWVGVTIALGVKEVRAFDGVVDAVRVLMKKPKAEKKPEIMDENHPNFAKAYEAVKAGQYTIEAIQSKYQLTEIAFKYLQQAENEAV